MPTTLHLALAWISAVATALVATEAGWRALRDRPPGSAARWLAAAQLAALVITSMAGFGIIASGKAADSGLHYLLAVVALLSVPAAPMFAAHAGPRRRALITCVAGLVALAFVGLLFVSG